MYNRPMRLSIVPQKTRLGLIVLAAIIVRLVLFFNLPILFTSDSWDYLGATYDIAHRLDFNSVRLRDVRMPTYPALLAAAQPVTGQQSARVVMLQKALGVLTVLMGIAVGRVLRVRGLAEGLAIFLGFNPVYLLYEHTLMTETLFLVVLLGFTLAASISLTGRLTWWKGVVLGSALGLCVLTRANALPICIILAGGVGVARYLRESRTSSSATVGAVLRFALITCLTGVLVVGPWLWRNGQLYGNLSLVNFSNRNLLIYKATHHPLDTTLPRLREVNVALSTTEVNYDWLWSLAKAYPTIEAERIAASLVWEQLTHHADVYAQEVIESVAGFVGLHGAYLNERTAGRILFRAITDPAAMQSLTSIPDWVHRRYPDFEFQSLSGNPVVAQVWAELGLGYLTYVRPLLFAVFISMGLICLLHRLRVSHRRTWEANVALKLMGVGYVVTLLVHAVTLTDNERYAVPFDWLLLACVVLMIECLRTQQQSS